MSFSIRAALTAIPLHQQQTVVDKLNNLVAKMRTTYQLDIRDDSRLVWSYITNNLHPSWTEQYIMNELCLMHYIYNATKYQDHFASTIPVVHDHLQRTLFANYPQYTNEYVRKFVIPLYRIRAMMDAHEEDNSYPTKWPWIDYESTMSSSSSDTSSEEYSTESGSDESDSGRDDSDREDEDSKEDSGSNSEDDSGSDSEEESGSDSEEESGSDSEEESRNERDSKKRQRQYRHSPHPRKVTRY